MVLEKILKLKREEILLEQKRAPLELIKEQIADKNFSRSLVEKLKEDGVSIIAELKKASPSLGIIRKDYFPGEIAKVYEENGASAVSVLTEKFFFMGSDFHLNEVRESVNLPILRKDFIISEYQIYQSKKIGADAVLLITACLEEEQIEYFLETAKSVNLECVVEVHNEEELKKIEAFTIDIIGINNRNLKTFDVSLETSYRLKDLVKQDVLLISESGIKTPEDVRSLKNRGFNGVLIGEIFMKSLSPGKKLKEFLKGAS